MSLEVPSTIICYMIHFSPSLFRMRGLQTVYNMRSQIYKSVSHLHILDYDTPNFKFLRSWGSHDTHYFKLLRSLGKCFTDKFLVNVISVM
jgi:hypothetical protein